MLNWGVSPRGRGPWQLGRAQGGAAGGGWTPGWAEREAAGSGALCQQLPGVLVESLSAGRWRWQVGLRDTVGVAVLGQQPEPKCCLTTTRSAPWGAVPALALPGCARMDRDCSKPVAHGEWLLLGREGDQLWEGAVRPLG